MSIDETFYFIRQLRTAFSSIGAIIPTSRFAAAAMASEFTRRRGPTTILEAGAGTGAITAEIVRHLGPADRLVVCEINPDFVAYLRRRFEHEPVFRQVRDQVTFHAASVTELAGSQEFDCIVSAIPFTSLPPELTRAILERYRNLLKPGGTLTYIEYAWLRHLKQHVAAPETHAQVEAVNTVLDHYIQEHQFRRDMVWRNVPPAWIRHLRFSESAPAAALHLRPREYIRRITIGNLAVAADALPLVASLSGLSFLLARLRKRRATQRLPLPQSPPTTPARAASGCCRWG